MITENYVVGIGSSSVSFYAREVRVNSVHVSVYGRCAVLRQTLPVVRGRMDTCTPGTLILMRKHQQLIQHNQHHHHQQEQQQN